MGTRRDSNLIRTLHISSSISSRQRIPSHPSSVLQFIRIVETNHQQQLLYFQDYSPRPLIKMGPAIINKPYREILAPLPILIKKTPITTECAPGHTTPDHTSQPFRFLDLPGELRNHIYRCLLHKETRQRLGLSNYTYKSGTDLDPCKGWLRWRYNDLQPAILATSHAVHDEAAAIMYGTQPFYVRITGYDLATVWTVNQPGPKMLISPRYMRLIKRFKVQADLCNCRLGSSGCRANMWYLWDNIQTFCHLIKGNSLARMEIEFNNLLLRRAMVSMCRWPEMNLQLEGQEILDAFLVLRDVRDVVITGDVQPLYAMQLKAFMEISTR